MVTVTKEEHILLGEDDVTGDLEHTLATDEDK
jgi:hypothetical protein